MKPASRLKATPANPDTRRRNLTVVVALTVLAAVVAAAVPNSQLDTPEPTVTEENPHGLIFTRVENSGLTREATTHSLNTPDALLLSGGLAAGDYDLDGNVDLYVAGAQHMPNHLYSNQGDGTFVEVGAELGVDVAHWGSGPAWGDIDADGDLDLFVGSVSSNPIYLFENRVNEEEGGFVDITKNSDIIAGGQNVVSALFFDYNVDGYLDLILAHWDNPVSRDDTYTLYRNNGDYTFTNVSIESGIAAAIIEVDRDWSFAPSFSDIDNDGDADLLMASDFGTSQIVANNGDGTFTRITDRSVIIDQAGMGSAVGDYDNDGFMDWFVTSIYNLDRQGGTWFGNRLYNNIGNGQFEDITVEAGVEDGAWGWGACAADFDHDGYLDIAHVNGWITDGDSFSGKIFEDVPVRFFRNRGELPIAFDEIADEVGLDDAGQGRGIVCFDADRDGDLDIVIVNNGDDHLVFYRNDTELTHHHTTIRLESPEGNRFGVGARVTATTEYGEQIRDLGGSNNYVSHNPLEVHFGLWAATSVDIEVQWPDGTITTLDDAPVDQLITIRATEAATRLIVNQGFGTGGYEAGDEIEIQARPAREGYFFSHWTSNGGGAFEDVHAATTVFTMPDSTVSVTANYLPGAAPDAEVSVARRWNEVLLAAIRNDYARPTVHARNLFHVSSATYDAWAAYADLESTWLLGSTQGEFMCDWDSSAFDSGDTDPDSVLNKREKAISYAAFRLITYRFGKSIGSNQTVKDARTLMSFLEYDTKIDSTDWKDGTPESLGNYIATCYIDFGTSDGANENDDYRNIAYQPVNPPLRPELPGNPDIVDLNRWQPLALAEFIDQAGNPSESEPEFLSPEWGSVWPFALGYSDLTIYTRDTFDYWVYHDPGGPPTIDGLHSDSYKWGFSLVSVWSSHLDPADGVNIDISPASLGNIQEYPNPTNYPDYDQFFDLVEGGDPSPGYSENPVTQEPYEPQVVPRGDYTRVLAEFWADGPDSETPPGHWFVILNEVNEHPLLERRMEGLGPVLDHLEWDVKAYFALGGAMHDAAISAWGIKGWYDYIRPISAIRAMADRGQSSDSDLASYAEFGIPLVEGYIELVDEDDELAGDENQHVGKVKLLAWKGPDYITDPEEDAAGVDWILADNWWPYQRPTFVTPPFAGFVSGHSTYSRSAAEVLTALTGSEYFPGGMSGFEIKANEFLVFERGPSVDMTLQWAKYYDAADQCSLSRIWGGIHPPADDIPGRLIGIQIGKDAFDRAMRYFNGESID